MKPTTQNIVGPEDLKLIGRVFTQHWYLYIIIPVILGLAAYLYAHRLTDIYQAKVQLILKSTENEIGNPFKDYYTSVEETSNQIMVLKSSNILEEVIKKMQLNVSYFIVGRIKTTEVYQNMPFMVKSENYGSNTYGIPFNINIIDSKKFKLKYVFADQTFEKEYLFGEFITDHDFFFTVEKSQSLNEAIARTFKNTRYMFVISTTNHKIDKYKKNLTISKEEWTSIVTVSLDDEIPERAVSFLDTLSKIYIDFSLQNKIETNRNSLEYISKQINEVVDIINGIEQELEVFKEDRSILNIEREESAFYGKLVESEVQLNTIQQKIQSIVDLKKYLIESHDDRFLPPSYYVLKDDEFIQNSVTKLYEFQMNKNDNLLEKTEKTLPISKIDNSISQTKKNLLTYLHNTESYLKEKRNDLSGEINNFESKLKFIPKKQRQLLNIQRKLDVNEKLYTFLLEKRAENLIKKAAILPETKVIEKPRSFGVMFPNRRDIVFKYLGIGLVIALIISLIRVFFYAKITTLEELGDHTSMTILGGIPQTLKSDDYLVVESPRGALTESFRNIRANLQYLFDSDQNQCRVMMVTSIFPGEGKTFNSINISAILAKANKRVIIIDFDMHKPRLHKGLGAEKDNGLSNVLIGKSSLEEVIFHTRIENLHAIFSGPVPPNASELVLSKKVEQMINQLKTQYDYIILDTPPLSMISDGLTLINHCQVALFIMNTKHASRSGARFLEDVSQKNPQIKTSLILNGLKSTSWRYYYGKYSYKYGYNYGYGNGYYGETD